VLNTRISYILCKILESPIRGDISGSLVEMCETKAKTYWFPLNFSMTFFICVLAFIRQFIKLQYSHNKRRRAANVGCFDHFKGID